MKKIGGFNRTLVSAAEKSNLHDDKHISLPSVNK